MFIPLDDDQRVPNALQLVPLIKDTDAYKTFQEEHDSLDKKVEALIELNSGSDAIFRVKKPKNFSEGLSSGLLNVGSGLLHGIGAFIASPITGARNGIGGFCKGVGVGVISLVALPVAGVGTGVYQMGRGVFEGPKAIHNSRVGKVWNKEKRSWEYFNLYESLAALEYQYKCYQWCIDGLMKEANVFKGSDVVKDTTYYDMLGVEPSSSPADIRKSYFRKAKDIHPDKVDTSGMAGPEFINPETGQLIAIEEAKVAFQQLGHAYKTLSDPERRRQYDVNGIDEENNEGDDDEEDMEFKLIFCSDELIEFFGLPQLILELEEEIGYSPRDDLLDGYSLHNVARNLHKMTMTVEQMKLAVRIVSRLEPAVLLVIKENAIENEGKKKTKCGKRKNKWVSPHSEYESEEFLQGIEKWKKECLKSVNLVLSQKPGLVLMDMLAWEYSNKAKQKIGERSIMNHRKTRAQLQANHKNVSQHLHVVKKAIHANKEMNEATKGGNENEFTGVMVETTMDTLLEVNSLFAMKMIRGALKYVLCESVLPDENDSESQKMALSTEVQARAVVLLLLGKVIKEQVREKKLSGEGSGQWTDAMLQAKLRYLQKKEEKEHGADVEESST